MPRPKAPRPGPRADRPAPDPAAATPGGRLRLARERRGLTQVAVAEALGISPQALNNLERGRRSYSDGWALLAAGTLGWPVAELAPHLEAVARPGPPAGGITLARRDDGPGWAPLSPDDAARLGRVGWDRPAIDPADLPAVADLAARAGAALLLLPWAVA